MNVVKPIRLKNDSGVALFAALGLLLVFTMLGAAYIRYSQSDYLRTRIDIQKFRSNHLSRGGIYSGIGEIQSALEAGEEPAEQYKVNLPVYRTIAGEMDQSDQNVTIAVWDESAKVNLNHAPKKILAALGIPGPVVDAYRKKARGKKYRPLVSVDDLRTRDFMNSQKFNSLDRNLFTTYTGSPDGSESAINLNQASPKILAAVFNIDGEEAATLAQKRPFTSWDDVRTKVGREPITYNTHERGVRGDEMPPSVSLGTHTYRLLSEAFMTTEYTTSNGLYSGVEAVVNFAEDGRFSIRFWNETPSEDIPEVEDAIPAADDVAVTNNNETTENAEAGAAQL